MASVVAIASGVVVWIAYVTSVIVDLLYLKQLAFFKKKKTEKKTQNSAGHLLGWWVALSLR